MQRPPQAQQIIEKINKKLEDAREKLIVFINGMNQGQAAYATHAKNILEAGLFENYNPMTVSQKLEALNELVKNARRLDPKNLTEVANVIEDLVIQPLEALLPIFGDQIHLISRRSAPDPTLTAPLVARNPASFMKEQPPKQTDQPKKVKIFLLGDSKAGTSSLHSILLKKSFDSTNANTRGIDQGLVNVSISLGDKKVPVKLEIWDVPVFTNPQAAGYLRGASIYIIVCDLTNRESFNKIVEMNNYLLSRGKNSILYLVGTKADLPNKVVTEDELSNLANELNCYYSIVSAKTGSGIEQLQEEMLQRVLTSDIGVSEKQRLR